MRWHRPSRQVLLLLMLAGLASVVSAGAVLSYDAPCAPASPVAGAGPTMRALLSRCYGSPDVLVFGEVPTPTPADGELLVAVHAAAVNPLDWHYARGKPYLMRLESGLGAPKDPRVGVDFAGTVTAVGSGVTRFKVGDAVFGSKNGAIAEFLVVGHTDAVTLKPPNLSFEQAAGVPVAAVTALQALRDSGKVRPGHKVLVNGASGGVGTFAVQIAKALGAEVTGVSSGRNTDLVRALGAAHAIDYTREDFTAGDIRYDVIIDAVGNRALSDMRRVLTPKGVCVLLGGGGPDANPWVGPFLGPLKALMYSPFVDQTLTILLAHETQADLEVLRDLMRSGAVTPVVDRTYPFDQAIEALRYLEQGRARGKVVISVAPRPGV